MMSWQQNHVNFLTFNGFRPLNSSFQTKPFQYKAMFWQLLQKFRYVERDDMKVGLQCLELKAPMHFLF
jgi:hypothetical protein